MISFDCSTESQEDIWGGDIECLVGGWAVGRASFRLETLKLHRFLPGASEWRLLRLRRGSLKKQRDLKVHHIACRIHSKKHIKMYIGINLMNRKLETESHTGLSYHGVVALSARYHELTCLICHIVLLQFFSSDAA